MDPHTEQDAVLEINDDTYTSYINRYPKVISMSDWDTTMAFCFYLKNTEDAQFFYETIELWKEETPEDYIICTQDTKKEITIDHNKQAEFEEDFELI